MDSSTRNPLNEADVSESELHQTSLELTGMMKYWPKLENKDTVLQTFDRSTLIRALYLLGTPEEKALYKKIANGEDEFINHYSASLLLSSRNGETAASSGTKKKPRRKSMLQRLGLSPTKKSSKQQEKGVEKAEEKAEEKAAEAKIFKTEGLLSTIQSNISSGKRINVHMLIHLLDGSTETVTLTKDTTAAEIHMAMSVALGIDHEIADECVGLFEYSMGVFKLLGDEDSILGTALKWEQEHINDRTSRIVYKRKCYRRHDALEMAERAVTDRKKGVHRMMVGSVNYHTCRGLYPIGNGQAFAYAAATLYAKSGGNSSSKALKTMKKAVKKHNTTIFPPRLQELTGSNFKHAVKAIILEYKKMRGLDILEVEQVICRNVRSWTDVYGASFYPIKCKKAKDISNPTMHFEVAILGISYETVAYHIYGNGGTIVSTITIPFDEITDWNTHELVVRNNEKLMLVGLTAEDHESEGMFAESDLHEEITKQLEIYRGLHQKYDAEEGMGGAGSQRKVGRRASVKMVASAILDDIGDSFNEDNWGNADDNDDDAGEPELSSEDESEEKSEEEEDGDEIWDEHHDDETNEKYYVGQKSRRSSWIIPSNGMVNRVVEDEDEDEDQKEEETNDVDDTSADDLSAAAASTEWIKHLDDESGDHYFVEKHATVPGGRRSSWILPPGGIHVEDDE